MLSESCLPRESHSLELSRRWQTERSSFHGSRLCIKRDSRYQIGQTLLYGEGPVLAGEGEAGGK